MSGIWKNCGTMLCTYQTLLISYGLQFLIDYKTIQYRQNYTTIPWITVIYFIKFLDCFFGIEPRYIGSLLNEIFHMNLQNNS